MLFRKKNRILPNEEDYKWNGVHMQAHTLNRHQISTYKSIYIYIYMLI